MTIETFRVVFLPLLTVLMSGCVASVVTFRLNAKHQRREVRRAKLEDAYAATHEFCNALGGHFLKYYGVFKGEISIDQANDMTIANDTRYDKTAYLRLELLVAMYVPRATQAFHDLLACREEMNALVREHRRRYLIGEVDCMDLVPRLNEPMTKLDEIDRRLKDYIVAEVGAL